MTLSILVFLLTVALTFGASAWGRLRGGRGTEEDLAGRGLNRWLVGLSAGTTGNSGFIVTGAVGLGYAGGVQWFLLPLSWLAGDLVFWALFPERLNRYGRETGATTVSDLITAGLAGRLARIVAIVVAVLLVVFLATYTSAQWLAGKKFLSSILDLSEGRALALFGLTIVLYSALGGFRGSVYSDTVQAVIRIVGTAVALGAVAMMALADQVTFAANLRDVPADFWKLLPHGSLVLGAGFLAGYACAAVGFGLGQPQIVTRYLAGASPEETRGAQWIYISFLQGTWLAMTAFGILLRGVMPGIADPETGLSVFFRSHMGALATGVIFADVFATIASTSNGLLIAISQMVRRDLLGGLLRGRGNSLVAQSGLTLAIGLVTIGLSFVLPGNVFSIAVDSVSKIGAALAGPVMIKLFRWRHNAASLLAAIVVGLGAGYLWKAVGLGAAVNEAGVGVAASLAINWAVIRLFRQPTWRGPTAETREHGLAD